MDGSTKEFLQTGLSANTAEISVYIMSLEDETYLDRTYGETIGKVSVTGYCSKFKALRDIDLEVMHAAMRMGFEAR